MQKEAGMNTANRIPGRIAEALCQFPPFSMFPQETIVQLAREAQVKILVKGDTVWMQGDPPTDAVLFLARGRVEYHRTADGVSELVDVRDVGDILGLSALHAGESFRVTAQVLEDSVLYILPWPRVRALLEANDPARYYVRRHLFWGTRVGRTLPAPETTRGEHDYGSILEAHLDGAQVIEPRPAGNLLTCPPSMTIQEAAGLMVMRGLPSVVVIDPAGCPLGYVTEEDLVKHVVVGTYRRQEPVEKIMSRMVCTVAPKTSTMAALLTMLHGRMNQLCVTEDGTAESRALDVCTPEDLLAQSGHHPVGILNGIHHALRPARFRELCDDIEAVARTYLEAGISGIVMGQICAQLFDELISRLLEISIEEMARNGIGLPEVEWAWMAVGSDGRREQVLRTDMDNAMVFAASGDPETDEQHRAVFLQLADRVIERLVDSGFARCQGGVMASNPRWCRTDEEWIAELNDLSHLQQGDGMLRAIVLYDLRHVAGSKELCRRVRDCIFEVDKSRFGSLYRLAELVVANPPPLNFWGKFVVEKKGGNEGEFDIKKRGLAPLRDAARVFALYYGLRNHHSTGGRWRELATAQPEMAELAHLAMDGYELMLRHRTLAGLKRGDDGRFIDPSELTKLEREHLASVFDVQRMVQSAVRRLFNLDVMKR
jgi:CBS domain-containing protein